MMVKKPDIGEINVPRGYKEFPAWFDQEYVDRKDEDWLAGINLGIDRVLEIVEDKLTDEEQIELGRWLMSMSIYGCFYETALEDKRKNGGTS